MLTAALVVSCTAAVVILIVSVQLILWQLFISSERHRAFKGCFRWCLGMGMVKCLTDTTNLPKIAIQSALLGAGFRKERGCAI